MILKRLYDYAVSLGDKLPAYGMELKEIEFVILIDADGRFVRIESKRIDKKRCAEFIVPKGVKRASGAKSNLLWDNTKYVIGSPDGDTEAHNLFKEYVTRIATLHPANRAIQALAKFYSFPKSVWLEAMKRDSLYDSLLKSSSNITFQLIDETELIPEKTELLEGLDNPAVEKGESGRCLITGDTSSMIRLFTSTSLPGNSPGASLVSFQTNSGYDSYGKTQAFNSPISVEAEFKVAAALKYLLSKDSRNKVRVGDRMFLFWGLGCNETDAQVEEALYELLALPEKGMVNPDARTEVVTKLFKSIFSGEIKTTLDDRFCILGLAPNSGRIAVVAWSDAPLREFASKIMAHLEDMEMADNRKEGKRTPFCGVYSMISAVTLGGKASDALPNLIDETVKAVMGDTPYPFSLYTSALNRIRAELQDIGVTVQRAAILKAYLNRKNRHTTIKPIEKMLDKTNDNPGYVCGRLIAVLEKIQSDAKSGDSIRTRYMGAASATPGAVFPTILNLSIHHSEKLGEGAQIFYEQLKQEILSKLSASGFPTHLDLQDQGRFFVGYYHQRNDLYTKKEA